MFATCGKPDLAENHLTRLQTLGQAIHAGHLPLVFDHGFVSLVEQRESEVNCNAKPSARNGSETGSGKRQPTRSRPRPSREAKPFRSRATEEVHGAGFRLLAQHYDALGVEDNEGLWVAVESRPLGNCGPQAHFLIAAPNDPTKRFRSWAFTSIGNGAATFPLKHTNFPDASICAFTAESGAWSPSDGLLPLVDHYSLWAVKSWHREVFGWWPGPQIGACALYRRREFVGQEWCGCGSGKRYSDCHQLADAVVDEHFAQKEFRNLFRLEYEDRAVPTAIVEAAKARWKKLPTLSSLP